MADVRVDVIRLIDADSSALYRCLADFENHFPQLLPPSFTQYQVETGGLGEGTIISFDLTANGTTQRFRMRISEPILGKVITGFDQRALVIATIRLRRERMQQVQVEIDTSWPTERGIRSLKSRLYAYVVLRPQLIRLLDRLEKHVRTLPPEDPTNQSPPGRIR